MVVGGGSCRFYVTPKSYLDLISLFLQLLSQRQQELHAARDRLLNGLDKLQGANEVVDRMQRELAALQPVLVEKTASTQELLLQVCRFKPGCGKVHMRA